MKFTETSLVVFLLRNLFGYYFSFKDKISKIYYVSLISRIVIYFKKKISLSFKFSFLKVFVEVIEKGNQAVLYNSKFSRWMVVIYRKLQNRIIEHLKTSQFVNKVRSVRKELSLYSLRTISIIFILAVGINLMLSVILNLNLGTSRLVIISILLIMAIFGLLCDVDWKTLKENSIILKIPFR